MDSPPVVKGFLKELERSFREESFISLSLGHYAGQEEGLKNAYLKKVLIKKEEKASVTYRYARKDIVKNFSLKEGVEEVARLLESGFKAATLFDLGLDGILQKGKNGNWTFRKSKPTKTQPPSLQHDHAKIKKISANDRPYLTSLKITDQEGNVFKNAQDKFRQINHYIEILSSFIRDIPTEQGLSVVDMGAGKGYLTFALYDYLNNTAHISAEVTGVEFRPDLVELCNGIAQSARFDKLQFVQGTIEDYPVRELSVLIALHACDTATDDAIAYGIKAGAELIVVAPCCHKQIRREIEKNRVGNELDFLTKYGIFMERQAEMVTDGIRALILEYFGYKTKILEFVSDVHTPKNVLVVGIKSPKSPTDREAILKKLKDTREYFGIGYHHLEKIMGLQ